MYPNFVHFDNKYNITQLPNYGLELWINESTRHQYQFRKQELPKMHKGRTTAYNCPYPECNQSFPSGREVKQHLETEHRTTQALLGGNEDLDLSVKRAPSTKRVVIFQVAGKLHWPALVLSEDAKTVTARLFNKKSVVKTVPKENVKDFDFESHKYHISQGNSEHKHAFNEAKKLMDD